MIGEKRLDESGQEWEVYNEWKNPDGSIGKAWFKGDGKFYASLLPGKSIEQLDNNFRLAIAKKNEK